jgi:hypothetical protein
MTILISFIKSRFDISPLSATKKKPRQTPQADGGLFFGLLQIMAYLIIFQKKTSNIQNLKKY